MNTVETIERSYMEKLNQRQWEKKVRGQCVSELFKCFILRRRYYGRMLEMLRGKEVSCVKYDEVNNLLILGFKCTVEVWSLRKTIICKKYCMNEKGTVAAIESLINYKLNEKHAVEYKVAVRFTDWTVAIIYDSDLRRTKRKHAVKILYRLSEQSAKSFNPSSGLCYLKKYDVLLYPKVNGSIGIYLSLIHICRCRRRG
eukprot:TRINITY_DN11947_c0_g1_i7.p1 TRINITY_DN11947_c0_g1~~TRINITY_DN11947_c0_g1_i7.p1  ORF type:complete len:199 (+),score=19.40 TRINITY_DN11947_c0_g1_i7:298-894(+)